MGDFIVEIRDPRTGKVLRTSRIRGYSMRGQERLLVPDNLHVVARDVRSGEVLQEQSTHNIVTNAGINLLRDFLSGSSVTGITHLAVGSGTSSPSKTDTTLGSELARAAVGARTATAQKLTVTYTLPSSSAANGHNLTEAGLFNASSSGTMYARATHTAIAKTDAKMVSYTWELTWV